MRHVRAHTAHVKLRVSWFFYYMVHQNTRRAVKLKQLSDLFGTLIFYINSCNNTKRRAFTSANAILINPLILEPWLVYNEGFMRVGALIEFGRNKVTIYRQTICKSPETMNLPEIMHASEYLIFFSLPLTPYI